MTDIATRKSACIFTSLMAPIYCCCYYWRIAFGRPLRPLFDVFCYANDHRMKDMNCIVYVRLIDLVVVFPRRKKELEEQTETTREIWLPTATKAHGQN